MRTMGWMGTVGLTAMWLAFASAAGGCGGTSQPGMQPVAAPVAEPAPAGGPVPANRQVTFSSTTSGATFHYTTDGVTAPSCSGIGTTSATAMVAPTIWVVACKAGMEDSPVVKLSYQINNLAFVTSTLQDGNLGGLAGADALCAARATAAGLRGTYVAFLSTSTVNAIDRLASASGWVRVDGRPFVDTASNLAAGKLLYPLRLDENGAEIGTTAWVKTGSTVTGTTNGAFVCSDWTSTSPSQTMGFADSGKELWISYGTAGCSFLSRLYCLGVDYSNPIPTPAATGRTAFVSSAPFTSGGGVTAADSLCQGNATSAGLAGTYKALLATDGASPASRFVAGAPWVRRDGVVVAQSQATLATGLLDAPVNLQTDGTILGNYGLWLGADLGTAGTAASTCGGWTLATATDYGTSSVVGRSRFQAAVISPMQCSAGFYRVICLQE